MKKLEIGTPGAFRESAERFSEQRKKKPMESEVVEIIENAKKRQKKKDNPKKSARSRDLKA